jgi:hypothetical protein
MAPKEPRVSKQAAAGTIRHITFTTAKRTGKIREHGSATRQSVNTATHNNGLLTIQTLGKTLPVRKELVYVPSNTTK